MIYFAIYWLNGDNFAGLTIGNQSTTPQEAAAAFFHEHGELMGYKPGDLFAQPIAHVTTA